MKWILRFIENAHVLSKAWDWKWQLLVGIALIVVLLTVKVKNKKLIKWTFKALWWVTGHWVWILILMIWKRRGKIAKAIGSAARSTRRGTKEVWELVKTRFEKKSPSDPTALGPPDPDVKREYMWGRIIAAVTAVLALLIILARFSNLRGGSTEVVAAPESPKIRLIEAPSEPRGSIRLIATPTPYIRDLRPP